MSNTVLVSGGAGYIGSHACKALAAAGYQPVAYDNLAYGHESAVKWGPFERGDINDAERLDQVLKQYRPIAVMHFAAYAYVGESVQDPGKYYRNNVAGSLCLIEAANRHGIDKFIFSSTCATYGEPQQIPMTEAHRQMPINPYGHSKLMIEQMLRDFEVAHGLRSVSLRYFNAAGADPAGETGEDHDPETHLIPLVLDAALGVRPGITVFGDDYDTPDGTCVRDYIHVTDLADAHVSALRYLEKGGASGAFNLGNGNGFSVMEIIETAKKVTGKAIPFSIGPRRAGDPPKLIGDSARIRQVLNWQPAYADIETIIETAWQWQRKLRT